MARVWRDGQRKRVFIYRFLSAGTIEEKMYQRQVLKEEVSKAVVDASAGAARSFTREDLREVFTLGNGADEVFVTARTDELIHMNTRPAVCARVPAANVRDVPPAGQGG